MLSCTCKHPNYHLCFVALVPFCVCLVLKVLCGIQNACATGDFFSPYSVQLNISIFIVKFVFELHFYGSRVQVAQCCKISQVTDAARNKKWGFPENWKGSFLQDGCTESKHVDMQAEVTKGGGLCSCQWTPHIFCAPLNSPTFFCHAVSRSFARAVSLLYSGSSWWWHHDVPWSLYVGTVNMWPATHVQLVEWAGIN